MASSTIKIAGLQELGERMRKLSTKVSTSLAGSATGAAAKVVKLAAIQNVRTSPSVETGSLAGAVISKKLPKGDLAGLSSAHIVTVRGKGSKRPYSSKGKRISIAPHARFVELGTANMAAEPFLRPALQENIQPAIQAMTRRLADGLQKAGA